VNTDCEKEELAGNNRKIIGQRRQKNPELRFLNFVTVL
jgi:hypothetical protein